MKKTILSLVAALLFSTAFAAKGLVVTQTFTTPGIAPVTLTWYVTANNCKLKMLYNDAGKVSTNWFLPDAKTGMLNLYNEAPVVPGAQKGYFQLPAAEIKPSADMAFSRISVITTTETKQIAGNTCQKVIVKTNKHETEMWVTTGFKGSFYQFYPFFKDNILLLSLNEEKIQGFPLEATTRDASGNVLYTYTATSVTEAELSEADFTVPADYKSPDAIKNSGK